VDNENLNISEGCVFPVSAPLIVQGLKHTARLTYSSAGW